MKIKSILFYEIKLISDFSVLWNGLSWSLVCVSCAKVRSYHSGTKIGSKPNPSDHSSASDIVPNSSPSNDIGSCPGSQYPNEKIQLQVLFVTHCMSLMIHWLPILLRVNLVFTHGNPLSALINNPESWTRTGFWYFSAHTLAPSRTTHCVVHRSLFSVYSALSISILIGRSYCAKILLNDSTFQGLLVIR